MKSRSTKYIFLTALFLSLCLTSCERHTAFLQVGTTYEGWSTATNEYKKFTVLKNEGNGWFLTGSPSDPYWLNTSGFFMIKKKKDIQNKAEQGAAANP